MLSSEAKNTKLREQDIKVILFFKDYFNLFYFRFVLCLMQNEMKMQHLQLLVSCYYNSLLSLLIINYE